MKNLTLLALVIVAVAVMLFAGVNGIMRDHSYGPFFVFVAVCTAAGLSLDITKMIRERIRKANLRKLGGR
jgi:hypothetical protein